MPQQPASVPSAPVPPEAEVPSPCNGVCTLDGAGYCLGCGRSGEEIGEWPAASAQRRRRILAEIRRRAGAGPAKQEGDEHAD